MAGGTWRDKQFEHKWNKEHDEKVFVCETALFICFSQVLQYTVETEFTLCSSVICWSDAFEALLAGCVPPETDQMKREKLWDAFMCSGRDGCLN